MGKVVLPKTGRVLRISPKRPTITSLTVGTFTSAAAGLSNLHGARPNMARLAVSRTILIRTKGGVFVCTSENRAVSYRVRHSNDKHQVRLLPTGGVFSSLRYHQTYHFTSGLLFILPSGKSKVIITKTFEASPGPLTRVSRVGVRSSGSVCTRDVPSTGRPQPSAVSRIQVINQVNYLKAIDSFYVKNRPERNRLGLTAYKNSKCYNRIALLRRRLSLITRPIFRVTGYGSIFPLPKTLFIIDASTASVTFSSFSGARLASTTVVSSRQALLTAVVPVNIVRIASAAVQLLAESLGVAVVSIRLSDCSPVAQITYRKSFLTVF